MSTSIFAGIGDLPCFTTFKLFPCFPDLIRNRAFLQLIDIETTSVHKPICSKATV